ncbi:MAG: IS630 transposase-related protein [Sphingorhabdus sp.]
MDFRRKVISVRKAEGLTIGQVSARFCVGIATVTRWLKRIEPQLTRIKPATKIDRIALARDVREHPDAYLHERAGRLGASVQGIAHALRRMNITYKKSADPSQGKRRRTACLPAEDSGL